MASARVCGDAPTFALACFDASGITENYAEDVEERNDRDNEGAEDGIPQQQRE